MHCNIARSCIKLFRSESKKHGEIGAWKTVSWLRIPTMTFALKLLYAGIVMMAFMRGNAAKEIARERIGILISNALELAHTDEIFADKQAQLAKKIAMRSRVRMAYDARQLYCKKCKRFIIPGKTSRVRVGGTNTKSIRITCIMCGHIYRKILHKL